MPSFSSPTSEVEIIEAPKQNFVQDNITFTETYKSKIFIDHVRSNE